MKFFKLDRIDINCDEFKAWQSTATKLTNSLKNCIDPKNARMERREILRSNTHWTRLKPLLKKIFGDLCWYTDCDLTGSFGDIDHFRPKSSSCDLDGNIILDEGYWWLAYDYRNFRLSCEYANRKYKDGGKSTYFPVANENGVKDIPILLDPCNYNDTELVGYREGGVIFPETINSFDERRVKVSEKVYNWNEFIDRRNEKIISCDNLISRLKVEMDSEIVEQNIKNVINDLKNLLDPRKPYSSIAYKYIRFLSLQPVNSSIKDIIQDILKKAYEDIVY